MPAPAPCATTIVADAPSGRAYTPETGEPSTSIVIGSSSELMRPCCPTRAPRAFRRSSVLRPEHVEEPADAIDDRAGRIDEIADRRR